MNPEFRLIELSISSLNDVYKGEMDLGITLASLPYCLGKSSIKALKGVNTSRNQMTNEIDERIKTTFTKAKGKFLHIFTMKYAQRILTKKPAMVTKGNKPNTVHWKKNMIENRPTSRRSFFDMKVFLAK